MRRFFILSIIASILIPAGSAKANVTPQSGLQAPTLVIVDTALDTSMSIFKDKLVQEVCIVEFDVCPNGKAIMEGPGSATLPRDLLVRKDLEHGTQMASLALRTNPQIKLIFIRIAGVDSKTKLLKPRGNRTIEMVLDWIIANQSKYNIHAVAVTQSTYNVSSPKLPFYLSAPGTDYCPKYPNTEVKINQLIKIGVPTFFPTGNNRDQSRVGWPSCIASSIAVGAVYDYGDVADYSNNDVKLVDFYAQGNNQVLSPGNKLVGTNGTSGAAIIASTIWTTVKTKRPELDFNQTFKSIIETAKTARFLSNTKLVNSNKYIVMPNSQ